ncbi:MAG: hypothetical protein ACYCZB_13095 [Acidiphilium sp.]
MADRGDEAAPTTGMRNKNDLRPARGILIAVLVGLGIWLAIAAIVLFALS